MKELKKVGPHQTQAKSWIGTSDTDPFQRGWLVVNSLSSRQVITNNPSDPGNTFEVVGDPLAYFRSSQEPNRA